MKIYVVGSSKNKFLPLDNIREKFLIDQKHEGDNIDFLNPWYCELTGLYYLWKHCDDDIVGLEHYRRYFVNENNQLLNENEIKTALSDCDVLCKEMIFKNNKKTLDYLKNGKKFIYHFLSFLPKKEKDYFLQQFNTSKRFAQCNMFICRKEIINKYCDWFFENVINFKVKDFYNNKRIIGYIAEFVFGYWLQMNGYKIKYNKVKVC